MVRVKRKRKHRGDNGERLWAAAAGTMSRLLSSRSLGIEITDSEVRWVEIASGTCPSIVSVASEPLPEGVVDEGRIEQLPAVIQALQTLRQRTDSRQTKAHLLLPSTLTMIRFLKLPDVPMKDLAKMIDFELRFNIPLPFDRPHYDFVKLPASPKAADSPAGQEKQAEPPDLGHWSLSGREAAAAAEGNEQAGTECEVMVVAAPLDAIEAYASAARAAGLKPVSIEIKPLSLLRVVERLLPIDPKATFVSIDLTATYADVGIYRDGAMRIARNKAIRFPKAKPSVDEGANDFTMFEFQSACQDLASEVERFINFYRYSLDNRDSEVQHMLFSGDADRMSDIVAYFRERFPFAVDELRVENALQLDAIGDIDLIRYAAPLGLALRGRES